MSERTRRAGCGGARAGGVLRHRAITSPRPISSPHARTSSTRRAVCRQVSPVRATTWAAGCWLRRGNLATAAAALAETRPSRTSACTASSSPSARRSRRDTQLLSRERRRPISGCVSPSSRYSDRTSHASSISVSPPRWCRRVIAILASTASTARTCARSSVRPRAVAARTRLNPSSTSSLPAAVNTEMGETCPTVSSERCMRASASGSHSRSAARRRPSSASCTTHSAVSPGCTVATRARPRPPRRGWRVTPCPAGGAPLPSLPAIRGRRVARDGRPHGASSVPAGRAETRINTGNRRARVARDSATALSQISSISALNRAGFRVEGGT